MKEREREADEEKRGVTQRRVTGARRCACIEGTYLYLYSVHWVCQTYGMFSQANSSTNSYARLAIIKQ